jgi:DNA-binding transcriptional MerR regulator
MKKTIQMTVKEMALSSGVTIRTLHHYDEIGLLTAQRTHSGYRVYTEKHALRLQQILLHKSFGLSLEDISKALDAPEFDNLISLQHQKAALIKQAKNMSAMIGAVDAAIKLLSKTQNVDLKLIFAGFDPSLYCDEVKEKWGSTVYWKESQKKTANYTAEDWQGIKNEESVIWEEAASALRSGYAVNSQAALKFVESYRKHIDRWFYKTSEAGFVELVNIWENDLRFVANIDKFEVGLTSWSARAVRAKYLSVT